MNSPSVANEIIREIKEKRKAFDKLYPLTGRQWYIATVEDLVEFNNQYPPDIICEFHFLIESRSILEEVLTEVLQGDKLSHKEITEFLTGKTTPVYVVNYCFHFTRIERK
jgi:hypothetical protein